MRADTQTPSIKAMMLMSALSVLIPALVTFALLAINRSIPVAYGHEQARAELLATPLAPAQAITLSPEARAILKARGVERFGIEPLRGSSSTFLLVVNGKALPEAQSRVHSPDQIFRIERASTDPQILIPDALREHWEPALVSFYIEREIQAFEAALSAQELRRSQWARPGLNS